MTPDDIPARMAREQAEALAVIRALYDRQQSLEATILEQGDDGDA